MFCYKCGATLPEGSAFCMTCGAKMPTVPSAPSAQPTQPVQPVQPVQPMQTVQPTKSNQQRTMRLVFGFAAAALAVLALILAAPHFGKAFLKTDVLIMPLIFSLAGIASAVSCFVMGRGARKSGVDRAAWIVALIALIAASILVVEIIYAMIVM